MQHLNLTGLSEKVGERTYHLLCNQDSPLSEVKEALCLFLNHVNQIESAALARNENADVEIIEEPQPV